MMKPPARKGTAGIRLTRPLIFWSAAQHATSELRSSFLCPLSYMPICITSAQNMFCYQLHFKILLYNTYSNPIQRGPNKDFCLFQPLVKLKVFEQPSYLHWLYTMSTLIGLSKYFKRRHIWVLIKHIK